MTEHTCSLGVRYSTIPAKCQACQDPGDPVTKMRAEIVALRWVAKAARAALPEVPASNMRSLVARNELIAALKNLGDRP